MPKITSEDMATKIATDALRKFATKRPINAKLVETLWYVTIDVGLFTPKLIEVEIDAGTGIVKRMR